MPTVQKKKFSIGARSAGALPLDALTGGGGEGAISDTVKFPVDLDNTGHHVHFTAYERKLGSVLKGARGESPINKKLASFYLPMPASLGVGYSASYQNEDIGLLGNLLAGNADETFAAIEGGMENIGTVLNNVFAGELGGTFDAIKQTGKDFATTANQFVGQVSQELGSDNQRRSAIAAVAASRGGGTAKTALDQIAGVAVNPHRVVLFQGTEFREHQFAYKLSAKNAEESKIITSLISGFKYYMHPRFSGGGRGFTKRAFIDYPQLFEIEFRKEDRRHLFAFKTCVLKSFSAQYHPMGYPAYIQAQGESAPVEVDIQMTFQEIEMFTKEDVEAEMASVRSTNRSNQLAFDESQGPF